MSIEQFVLFDSVVWIVCVVLIAFLVVSMSICVDSIICDVTILIWDVWIICVVEILISVSVAGLMSSFR